MSKSIEYTLRNFTNADKANATKLENIVEKI